VNRALFCLVVGGCSGNPAAPMTMPDLALEQMVENPDLAFVPACEPLAPRPAAVEVGVLPDDGEAPQVNVLLGAGKSIDMMIYEMGYGGIFDAVNAKAKAGVTVRVLLDQGTTSNQKYFDAMQAAGVQVKWSDPKFPYQHAKFFVVDGKEAMISTGNYSLVYSIQRERNFTAHLTDAQDVADLEKVFDADWNQMDPDLSCTRLVVSPVNSRQRILDLLKSAQSSLIIESMQLADSDVRSAVAARKAAGVDVRVMLADPSWVDANAGAATFLKTSNIPVKYMSTPGVHVKAFVVDGTSAYIGSENFSYTSLSKNREVGVFVNDAASVKPIVDTFEKDYAVGVDF
jgi:cardiolipin synthase